MTTSHRALVVGAIATMGVLGASAALAYPPGVGITSKEKTCSACHDSNGPWSDEARTIIDVLDSGTKESLKAPDGTFRIEVARGQPRTVLTVIGRRSGDATAPRRNAWMYVDPTQIATTSLSKFAPGWDVNLPMSCRIVGDAVEPYPGAQITVLPMTVRPTDAARDAELELQIMLTAGEAVKGKGREGLVANLFMRKVALKVRD